MGFILPKDELVQQILLTAIRRSPHVKLTKTGVSLVPHGVLWGRWLSCLANTHEGRADEFLRWLAVEIPRLREEHKQARKRKSCS
ncbi:MAG: hypothetical protein UY52_C0011G0007 [Parcubacteria group bacterium GW2011_GWC2_49_9]|nr:MAG: hypothetical protein UY52_C0011G0007 [Parcubacteria group bacterium GW2011_GWC2_49_9]